METQAATSRATCCVQFDEPYGQVAAARLQVETPGGSTQPLPTKREVGGGD